MPPKDIKVFWSETIAELGGTKAGCGGIWVLRVPEGKPVLSVRPGDKPRATCRGEALPPAPTPA